MHVLIASGIKLQIKYGTRLYARVIISGQRQQVQLHISNITNKSSF